MSIRLTCPNCNKTIKAPENMMGQSAPCPNCKHMIAVSSLQPDSPPEPPPLAPPIPTESRELNLFRPMMGITLALLACSICAAMILLKPSAEDQQAKILQRYSVALSVLDKERQELSDWSIILEESQSEIEQQYFYDKLGFSPDSMEKRKGKSESRLRDYLREYRLLASQDLSGFGSESLIAERLAIVLGEPSQDKEILMRATPVERLPDAIRKEVERYRGLVKQNFEFSLLRLKTASDGPEAQELRKLQKQDPNITNYDNQLTRCRNAKKQADNLQAQLK